MLEGFIRSILPTMFKDWGMELKGIGLTLGIVAPISALGGALIAGLWLNRLGRLNLTYLRIIAGSQRSGLLVFEH